MNKPMRSQSGRWIRRGGNIAVILGGGPATEEQEVPIRPAKPFWQRVINPKIDVDAQRALISMANMGDPDAPFLLCAVESGRLVGIFKPDQEVPARMVRSRTPPENWWDILKPDLDARIMRHSPGRGIIVFRKTLTRAELIRALKRAALLIRPSLSPVPCPP